MVLKEPRKVQWVRNTWLVSEHPQQKSYYVGVAVAPTNRILATNCPSERVWCPPWPSTVLIRQWIVRPGWVKVAWNHQKTRKNKVFQALHVLPLLSGRPRTKSEIGILELFWDLFCLLPMQIRVFSCSKTVPVCQKSKGIDYKKHRKSRIFNDSRTDSNSDGNNWGSPILSTLYFWDTPGTAGACRWVDRLALHLPTDQRFFMAERETTY